MTQALPSKGAELEAMIDHNLTSEDAAALRTAYELQRAEYARSIGREVQEHGKPGRPK